GEGKNGNHKKEYRSISCQNAVSVRWRGPSEINGAWGCAADPSMCIRALAQRGPQQKSAVKCNTLRRRTHSSHPNHIMQDSGNERNGSPLVRTAKEISFKTPDESEK
ncbi:hypothetical protein NQZ68_007539, partial [Dissostichus eleginoides]